jgi:Family of unknown function (DUF6788)
MPSLEKLEVQRDRLKQELAQVGDMRPGSLVARFRKCGKPSCHCARADSPSHGPSWSLTRAVEGKTVTRVIPPGSGVEQTKAQLAEYRRFRDLVHQLVELNVQICDQKLEQDTALSGTKKNASGRRAGRRRRSRS